ncbi:MAG TPA: LysR substrate-binding domain-containing protein [Candidatus Limnocylindria bacterium]|jgi:DNA-binding transcriptional LysR family regulator|nr:LysR substrate-binding domain-containing protein [Candidatus Limnocylindria bacterium]
MHAPLPDLRSIRSFVAVAEQQSFGRAAESLNLAQPSLSLQIQKLERDLGVQLFRRTSRRVELTDAGEALLIEARALLAQAQIAVDTARNAGRGEIGRLRVGFYDTAPLIIMPALLNRFRSRYPRVHLHFVEHSSREQLAMLARGEVDIGILRGPVADNAIASRRIATETLLVALPEGHALARRDAIDVAALRDEPFVLLPRSKGSGLYDEIIMLCRKHGFSPTLAQEANETHTVCGLVAAGIGVSIVPSSVRALQVRGLAYRPLRPPATIQRCVAWLAASRSPALRAFVEMLPEDEIEV